MKKMWIYIIGIFLLITALILYSRFIGTMGIDVKEYKIVNDTITTNFHGLKIVHISDLHYGRIVNKNNIDDIVKKVNLNKPDIIVLTGDLIDRLTKLSDEDNAAIIDGLNSMSATLGKYAIIGNHDYVFDNWTTLISNGGFINLNDNYNLIYKDTTTPILIAGMSTNIKNKTKITTKMKEVYEYLDNLTEEDIKPTYKIMLMHETDYVDKIDYNKFDLILAGHSHNGQVRLPLIGPILLPEGSKKYFEPYYKLNDTDFYISSGLGTSTLNLRLFNKPSFNLYRITNK